MLCLCVSDPQGVAGRGAEVLLIERCCSWLQVLQVVSVLTHALAFAALYACPDTQSTAALTLLPAVAAVQMNSFAAKNHKVPAAVKPLKARRSRYTSFPAFPRKR